MLGGNEYASKVAGTGGDIKKIGRPDPFTYVPFDKRQINKKKSHQPIKTLKKVFSRAVFLAHAFCFSSFPSLSLPHSLSFCLSQSCASATPFTTPSSLSAHSVFLVSVFLVRIHLLSHTHLNACTHMHTGVQRDENARYRSKSEGWWTKDTQEISLFYTYIHTLYTRKHTHTYIHVGTSIYANKYTSMHACSMNANIRTYMHAHITHACTHTYKY